MAGLEIVQIPYKGAAPMVVDLIGGHLSIGETLPGYAATSWYGVLAPAATPKDVIGKLNSEIVKVVSRPDTAERLAGEGADPAPGTPDQFGAFIRSEIVRWAKVIKASGATPQ